MQGYKVLIPKATYYRAETYLNQLRKGRGQLGKLLDDALRNVELKKLSSACFLRELCNSKKTQIFAESQVFGDGQDWTLPELQLLGDISIAAQVMIFDDGQHESPIIHPLPLEGTLIFTCGALLRNDCGNVPADWSEVVNNNQLNIENYYQLYKQRLLPVFEYINQTATQIVPALVTVPGIGCGQFAGIFGGIISSKFQAVLRRLLFEYGKQWSNIQALYFDPYNECECSYESIHDIAFITQPFTKAGTLACAQLSHPASFKIKDQDLSHCQLFSLVAWDHVSWPGNDFYLGHRTTDDGVKSAATNAMMIFTGVEGAYCRSSNKYLPPTPYENWKEVVVKNKLKLWQL